MGGCSCAYYRRDKRTRAPSVITAIRTEQTRNRHARENDSDAAYSILSLLLDQGTPTFLYNQYLSKPRHTLSFRYPSPSAAAYKLARGGSLCEACPNPVCRRGLLQPTDSDSGVTTLCHVRRLSCRTAGRSLNAIYIIIESRISSFLEISTLEHDSSEFAVRVALASPHSLRASTRGGASAQTQRKRAPQLPSPIWASHV